MPDPSADRHDAGDLTALLAEASDGNVDALDRLVPLVYEQLRRIAHARLRSERPDHTLNTTALVHEAYIRLVAQTRVHWRDRAHFYGVAAEAMRRILINHANARLAAKRGGGAKPVPLDESLLPLDDEQADELIALDQALTRLREFNPRGARVVEYRFFIGLGNQEIAELLDVSVITVRRAWNAARAWLRRELAVGRSGGDAGPREGHAPRS